MLLNYTITSTKGCQHLTFKQANKSTLSIFSICTNYQQIAHLQVAT